jgi:iron-sulfur cluster assembly protein
MAAPAILTLTDAAVRRIRQLMEKSGRPDAGLRISLKEGGCAGYEYDMQWAEEPQPNDEVVEQDGVRVYVDPSALLFLLGSRMDYREDKLSSGFVFDNPNQVGACGCGQSVQLKPVDPAVVEKVRGS